MFFSRILGVELRTPRLLFLIIPMIYSFSTGPCRGGVHRASRDGKIIVSTCVHRRVRYNRFRVLSLILQKPASAYVGARNIMLSSLSGEEAEQRERTKPLGNLVHFVLIDIPNKHTWQLGGIALRGK